MSTQRHVTQHQTFRYTEHYTQYAIGKYIK